MVQPELGRTLAWLGGLEMDPVPTDWVPGATEVERSNLAGLASVVKHLVAPGDTGWPVPVREWMAKGVKLPDEVAEEVSQATRTSPDLALATLYSSLVRAHNRRVLGTFFTPHEEVELMLDRWRENEVAPASVVDIGAGVGVFTAAAAAYWPQAQIHAVDVNPITLGLLGARMSLADVQQRSDNVRLILEDYTLWIETAESPAPRLLLGNPPYTRWQLIPEPQRTRLARATSDFCGGRASMSAYITAASLKHIGPHDGLCLLLPAQWLESNYALKMRQKLLELKNRRVELWLVKSAMFEDATVDAVVLMVGTEKVEEQPLCFAEWRGQKPMEVSRDSLATEGWRAKFDRPRVRRAGRSVALDSLGSVRRGVATGANRFFILGDEEIATRNLPRQVLRPLVYRLRPFDAVIDEHAFAALDTSDRRWLLLVQHGDRGIVAVEDYLMAGERAGMNQSFLCSRRRPHWYDLTRDHVVPDVIIGSMTRGRFHVAANELGASITNNLYGWTWHKSTATPTKKSVLAWLSSSEGQEALRSVARRQGNDLLKLEPRALARMQIPVSALSS